MMVKLNNGQSIPAIGFGTWNIWPGPRAKLAVRKALQLGYRLIDTAKIYGNEKGVGAAIRESEIPRGDTFVTTKLWNGDQGYESGLQAFEDSLKRLGLDYVDLYLIHWPVTGRRADSWRALQEIYKSKRARSIGVSNYTVRHLEELLSQTDIVPAVNQVEFHPYLYKDQVELVDFCKKNKIVVEAYSPLAHGSRINDPAISKIATKYEKSNAQILLRWAIEKGTIPIPKSTDPDRMRENLEVFDFELSEKDIKTLDELSCSLRTCWDPNTLD